jgi:hypothetical protein
MAQGHGTGKPWSQESYWGFGDDGETEQDHLRTLAARQRERAACMRQEAAALRARNRLLRPTWPPAGSSGQRSWGGSPHRALDAPGTG